MTICIICASCDSFDNRPHFGTFYRHLCQWNSLYLQMRRRTDDSMKKDLTCVEICAGAGGQALGLENAGFKHIALVEIEEPYCKTLLSNHPEWNVLLGDVKQFRGESFAGVDLFAGGVPCPPFSLGGKQLGKDDERDLFPDALRLVATIRPKAVLLENVRGIFDKKFDSYREYIKNTLQELGYNVYWKILNASDFGVPQLRPRAVLVAIKQEIDRGFTFPEPTAKKEVSVGEALYDLMAERGWKGVDTWKTLANTIAPTIVGGSKKHGGADLGPTRARKAWAVLGIDGLGIADEAPDPDFEGMPRLTNQMVSVIQGFPRSWKFSGRKTTVYRQIGNAFPPPVAEAVGKQIIKCISN